MSDSPDHRNAESDSSENSEVISTPETTSAPTSESDDAAETAVSESSAEPSTEASPESSSDAQADDAAPEASSEEAPAATDDAADAASDPAAESTPEPKVGEPAAEPAEAETGSDGAADVVADATATADADDDAAETVAVETASPVTSPEASSDAAPEKAAAAEPKVDAEAAGGDADAPAAEAPAEGAVEATAGEAPSATVEGENPADDKSVAEVAAAAIKELHSDDPEMLALRSAMAKTESVEGRIIGWNKGGYHVALGKIAAFCPVSQIEIGKPKNPKSYVDRTYRFHVTEITPDGKRVVVSRSSALKLERKEQAERIKKRLTPGSKHKGRVTSLTDFGAFVNVGDGAEGLVHVSEISRARVEKPSDVLQTGQEVSVEVLKVEKGGQRISLSMKRLEPDPWKNVGEKFPRGTKFQGKVVRQVEFGLFIEVEPGLEGLLHVSRLPLGASLGDDTFAEGKDVEGWVQEVEPKRRRMSLSLREVADTDPWQTVDKDFPPGSVFEGRVEKVAKFGVFVELAPGLTGLLPFAVVNIPAEANPRKIYPVGKPIKVTILDLDKKRKRVSLGTEGSQAEGTPADFRQYMKEQEKGAGFGSLAAALQQVKND